MRLWTVHPQYLDPPGLVALWREALLARAVLQGKTKGYRNHPQLERFRNHAHPRSAISAYLDLVHTEAVRRGYAFDRSKVGPVRAVNPIATTEGQLAYEWQHLLKKLSTRNPSLYQQWHVVECIAPHPLFVVQPGDVEPWERI